MLRALPRPSKREVADTLKNSYRGALRPRRRTRIKVGNKVTKKRTARATPKERNMAFSIRRLRTFGARDGAPFQSILAAPLTAPSSEKRR